MRTGFLIAALLPLVIAITIFSSCKAQKDALRENLKDGVLTLQFTSWNQERSVQMNCREGGSLPVEINCTAGAIAIDIQGENGVFVYAGNGLKKENFSVTLPLDGSYMIRVRGKKADGRLQIGAN